MPEPDQAVPEGPGFPLLRVLAGVLLLAAAVTVVVCLSGTADLRLEARLEPANPAPGEKATLSLRVSPDSPDEIEPLQNVRARVLSSSGLIFERTSEYLLPGEGAMVLRFTVDKKAKPGPHRLVVLVVADLPAGARRSVARTVDLRRELELTVADPKAAEPKRP